MSDFSHEKTVFTGCAFEDSIDGYFPLSESLRQLMLRRKHETAFIRIIHTPAMELPGLAADAPVPVHITEGSACMIHQMTVLVTKAGDDITLAGIADWTWENDRHDNRFLPEWRLAEPAFIRGVAVQKNAIASAESGVRTPDADHSNEERSRLHIRCDFGHSLIARGESCVDDGVVRLCSAHPSVKQHVSEMEIIFSSGIDQRMLFSRFVKDHV